MENRHYDIITSQSEIKWTGKRVIGALNGTIQIKKGTLVLEYGKLVGGEFVIDTNTITISDLTDPAANAEITALLASDDFFSSELYPEASFRISAVEPEGIDRYYINGNLTIRDTTHPILFPAILFEDEKILKADAKIVVDRTQYGMRFLSGNFFTGLGDTLVYNNFVLQVHITATAEKEKVRLQTEQRYE